jgi:hypothetical protein
MVDQLERFAEPGSLARRQRDLGGRSVVDDLLAAPRHPAHVDVVADAGHRLVVRHAVESLDHLRTGGPEAEDEPAVRHVVEAGCGLGHTRGSPREHVEDARPDLDRRGLRREEAHLRHGVEAVGLGHPDHVEAGLLQFDDLLHVCVEVARVVDRHRELHGAERYVWPVRRLQSDDAVSDDAASGDRRRGINR